MNFRTPTRKIVALVMLVLTLNVMIIGFAPGGVSVNSFMAGISQTLGFEGTAGDAALDDMADFKPPKHSFIDYTSFFGGIVAVPAYQPVIAFMSMVSDFQFLPTIYTEIPVPPIIA